VSKGCPKALGREPKKAGPWAQRGASKRASKKQKLLSFRLGRKLETLSNVNYQLMLSIQIVKLEKDYTT
jgi:hypothetical protein